jgi:hypothetical protein
VTHHFPEQEISLLFHFRSEKILLKAYSTIDEASWQGAVDLYSSHADIFEEKGK